jgi:adenine deaminase
VRNRVAGVTGYERLIATARGELEPDLVIEGARVFSVFTKEWLDVDVAVAGGRVAGLGQFAGGERVDGRSQYLVPGFIDAHVHIESSKLMVDEYARQVVGCGTSAVVCDPHEIANVLGVDGALWILDASADVPIDVFVMAPPCVPASSFESPHAPLSAEDLRVILRHERALGVAEVMNFPGVIAGDPDLLEKVELREATHVDGHAPGVRGHALDAYIAAGIYSDHETTTYEEALEKRRKGMWVFLREASNARNLVDLLPLVIEYGTDLCAFSTDDREPDLIVREGHINQMCRLAVRNGLAPEDALVLASVGAARAHGLSGRGAIAPGYRADFSLLPDLDDFRPTMVFKDGRLVAVDGTALVFPRAPVPAAVRSTMHVRDLSAADLAIPLESELVRAIGVISGQLLTDSLVMAPGRSDGLAVADPSRDLAKVCVIERHHATGRVGKGFVTGFGLRDGAFASTVAHDAHNVVVVGCSDEDMVTAVARLTEIGGGLIVVARGQILGELPLPIAGLLSDRPAAEVVERLDELHRQLAGLGVSLDAPFTALSFIPLSVIPELKITDQGLVDVTRFELVELGVSA